MIPFILAFRGGTLTHEIMDFFGLNPSMGTSSAFNSRTQSRYRYNDEFMKRSGGLAPTVLGVCAYDATYMLAQAMKNALEKGELTRETLRDELVALDGFVGTTGPIKFNEIGDVTRKYRVCQIIDNEWSVLTDYDYY